jgi:hypothetical protein
MKPDDVVGSISPPNYIITDKLFSSFDEITGLGEFHLGLRISEYQQEPFVFPHTALVHYLILLHDYQYPASDLL